MGPLKDGMYRITTQFHFCFWVMEMVLVGMPILFMGMTIVFMGMVTVSMGMIRWLVGLVSMSSTLHGSFTVRDKVQQVHCHLALLDTPHAWLGGKQSGCPGFKILKLFFTR